MGGVTEGEDSCLTQLIDGDGGFNPAGLDSFAGKTGLRHCGLSYAVVAIMGPQSSGKSTLMNHLFRTSFREMDAFRGRGARRPRGYGLPSVRGSTRLPLPWIWKAPMGGSVVRWCHDIGREQAANKPLLKTVFQVMMRLFSPCKTTLLFVIRDKTKTPLEYLEPTLREDIQKIWDGVPKPEAHKSTPRSELFNVEVTALSSFEEKEDQFKEQED